MLKKIALVSVHIYQKIFSLETGFFSNVGLFKKRTVCVFYPSCSEYAKIAIEKHGFMRGILKTLETKRNLCLQTVLKL